MTLAERLRVLADQLPAGASVVLDALALRALAAEDGAPGSAAETAATEPVFTVETLSARLHRSPSTTRTWVEQGRFPGSFRLPGAKRAGAWRIPLGGVAAFEHGTTAGAAAQGGADLGLWRQSRQRGRT